MQWPYKAWGATAVFSGHDHAYERLAVDGLPYFVNGLGGASLYHFNIRLPESKARYNAKHGALLIEATALTMTVRMIDVDGLQHDPYALEQPYVQYLPSIAKVGVGEIGGRKLRIQRALTAPPSHPHTLMMASKFLYSA